MQIKNNIFIVTGASSGLGLATSQRLAQEGAKVVMVDMNELEGQKHASAIGQTFIRCDVTEEADAIKVVQAAQQLGNLRGLINCAGIAPAAKLLGKDGVHKQDLFSKVIAVNVFGTFNMSRFAAQAMAALEGVGSDAERGVIINTASVAAFDGQMGQVAYAASKAAVAGMTLPMARDLSRNGIRVMTIAPGIFETPMLLGMPQEVQDSLGKMVPFPSRLGKPAEYADLVVAIINNSMLNGETIRLDGAIRMQPK
jgi:NAD(P)-dependent dehydrogenase (short-subunit alcohol dehydrogenase family)